MILEELTRQEKEKIGVHFLIALGFLAIFGIGIAVLGHYYLKIEVLLLGLTLSIGSLLTYLAMKGIEERNYIRALKKPISDRVAELRPLVIKSIEFIDNLQKSFPPESLQWSKTGASHFISLSRISESLIDRLDTVEELANSLSDTKIQEAAALLEKPLTFETKLEKHLMDHNMPEMPSSSWVDSINFLHAELKKESEKFTHPEKKDDFINTIKTT